MLSLEEFKNKLKSYDKNDIKFTFHSEVQAIVREIDLEEIKENIINPEKLVYFEEQKAMRHDEKKYNCYFAYSEKLCHRYTIVLNRKVIIVTVVKINRDWQKIIG